MVGTRQTSVRSYAFGVEGSASNGSYDKIDVIDNANGKAFVPQGMIIFNDGSNDLLISADGSNLFLRLTSVDKFVSLDFFRHQIIYLQGDGAAVDYRVAAW